MSGDPGKPPQSATSPSPFLRAPPMTSVAAIFGSPLGCLRALRLRALWAAPPAIAVLGAYAAHPVPSHPGVQNKAGARGGGKRT